MIQNTSSRGKKGFFFDYRTAVEFKANGLKVFTATLTYRDLLRSERRPEEVDAL
jgi:hypothetical protein